MMEIQTDIIVWEQAPGITRDDFADILRGDFCRVFSHEVVRRLPTERLEVFLLDGASRLQVTRGVGS